MYPGMAVTPNASASVSTIEALRLRLEITALDDLLRAALVFDLPNDIRRALILGNLGLSILRGYLGDLLPVPVLTRRL